MIRIRLEGQTDTAGAAWAMVLGGKSQTSSGSSTTTIPPQVLQEYSNVNARANQTANQSFQPYYGEFVAPINGSEQAGIDHTFEYADSAQPYYDQAAGLTTAGAAAANPTNLDSAAINKYLSPYLGQVLGSTEALVNQQNQQQQAGQLGNAITSGAFGGDRTGIAAANLAQQEELAGGNLYSGIENQGYNTALQTAQQQQGVNLAAQQANLARLTGAGSQLAGIGTAAQTAGLAGAAQELSAGQVQQQTQQAQDTAQYNQFLQQQGYPFQVDQFLANIAEGTGSLSGSTTNSSSTSPAPFFSDERLKEDIEPIGKTFDGENIIKFRYKGSPQKHIGLSAQDVEKHHPEAVGLAGGYKTVDYDAATKEAAGLGAAKKYASGGYADGGMPIGLGGGPADYAILQQILNNARSIQGASPGAQMMPNAGSMPYGGLRTLGSVLESGSSAPRHLAASAPTLKGAAPSELQTGLGQVNQVADLVKNGKSLGSDASQAYNWLKGSGLGGGTPAVASGAPADAALDPSVSGIYAKGGYVHRDSGGEIDPYDDPNSYVPSSNNNIAERVAQFKAMQPKDPNHPAQSQSALGGLGYAAGTASSLIGLGKDVAPYAAPIASAIGSGVSAAGAGIGTELASLLPLLALASGGSARLHRDPGGYVLDDELKDGGDPFYLPLLQKGETGAQSPMGHPALDTLNPPLPPPRPRDLGAVGPSGENPTPPRGLGAVSSNDTAPAPTDQNHYEGQTLLNPTGISSNSGATVGGLGRAVAAAPQGVSDAWSRMIQQESGGHQFDQSGRTLVSKTGAEGVAQVEPGTGPEAAQLAGLPWDPARLATDKDYNLALGHAYYNKQLATFGSPDLAAAAYNAGPAAVQKALEHAQANGDSYLKYLPAETQAYVANVAGGGNATGHQNAQSMPNGIQVAQNDSPGGLGAIGKSITDAGNGVGNYMGQNQNWLVPLLEGLGTMAGSNSRYLGAAALQGLGGAAHGYEDVLNQQQHRGLVGAETGVQQAVGAEQRAATARGNIWTTPDGRTWALGPDGVLQLVGMAMNPNKGSVSVLGGPQAVAAQQGTASGAPAAPAPPPPPPAPTLRPPAQQSAANSGLLGPAARETMATDANNMRITPPTAADMKLSSDTEAQTNQNGAAAVSQGHMLNQLAAELSGMSDEGMNGGAYNDLKMDTLRKYNDLVATIGHPEWGIEKDDIAHNAAAGKISQTMQFAMSHGSEQNSSLALQAAALATPSAHYDKQSAAEMLAGLYVDKQGAIDRQQYLKQYRKELANQNPAMANNYRAQNAMQAFNKDHDDTQYGQEKEKLAKFLAFPGKYKGESPMNAFYHGRMSPDLLDRSVKTPGFSRYFLNQGGD